MTADRKSKTPSAPPTPGSPGSPGSLDGKPQWPTAKSKSPDSVSLGTGLGTVPAEEPPTLWKRTKSCLGHLAVILVLAGYTAAGGTAFRYLEHPLEVELSAKLREEYFQTRETVVNALLAIGGNASSTAATMRALKSVGATTVQDAGDGDGEEVVADDDYARVVVNEQLDAFQDILLRVNDEGVALDNETHEWAWTFSSSFFFAATVVTTIGYGNIAPRTDWGKIVCIVFALFGIPLTMIAIADMGKLFASCVQSIGKRLKRLLCTRKRKLLKNETDDDKDDKKEDEDEGGGGSGMGQTTIRVLGAIALLMVYIAIGGAAFMIWEDWHFLDAFYFCFITMTTIGLGDIVPEHQMFMLLCTMYILIGLAVTSTCIELARAEYEKSWQRMLEASRKLAISGSLAETLRKLNEQLETHGQIVDMSIIGDLRSAMRESGLDDGSLETPPPTTPPLYVIYETNV